MINSDFDNSLADIAKGGLGASEPAVQAAWDAIRADLRSRGPFTRMLLEMRATAHAAMTELVLCDASNASLVGKLQGEVRRYTHMMTILAQYRASAEVADVNDESDHEQLTDDDIEFIANLER